MGAGHAAGPACLRFLGGVLPGSGKGTNSATVDLQDGRREGVGVGGGPLHPTDARRPQVPCHPDPAAPVTLGEPPSPPRSVLWARRPCGHGGGFDSGCGRQVQKP